MPRQARLDAPGTLHHVIVMGIEKRKIVNDDHDRADFVSRMGTIALETETPIYAWALMTNHAHILLRSGPSGLSRYMRRLISAYAVSYNRRHRKHGHLFQDRYKSVACEEGPYFRELLRYIHLNPLQAKLVESLADLDRYRWCGHSVVMGRLKKDWLHRDYVLKRFGAKESEAKKAYRLFVKMGIDQGRRSDLGGGGLIRSQGGWSEVKAMRQRGLREKSDERILGSGKFVDQLIKKSDKAKQKKISATKSLQKIAVLVKRVCKKQNVDVDALKSGSRRQNVSMARSQLSKKLVEEYGLSLTETGRHLGVSASAVSKYLSRPDKKKS